MKPGAIRVTMVPMNRTGTLLALAAALLAWPGGAGAEIVERELGTDAAGRPVAGHVFQAGRGFRRQARASSLPLRRAARPAPARHAPPAAFWWCVPVIPLHGGAPGGPVTFWHGSGSAVSVTVIR